MNPRILVVDDNDSSRQILSFTLLAPILVITGDRGGHSNADTIGCLEATPDTWLNPST